MHTIHTIMPSLTKLRVHIAPVGFEVDRIVISAKKMNADKVWLLVHDNPAEDKAITYVRKVQTILKKAKIKTQVQHANRLNLFKILKSVKQIIEIEKDNDVFVNVASGSKIQAIACMMACQMFNDYNNIKPFYAEAENYAAFKGEQTTGVKNLQPLPTFEIQRPKPELIGALKILIENNGKIQKKQMAELAEKENLITVNAREENFTQARFASLDKNIIQPLQEQWKFIDVEKIGRNRWIKITQEGINAAEFLI